MPDVRGVGESGWVEGSAPVYIQGRDHPQSIIHKQPTHNQT